MSHFSYCLAISAALACFGQARAADVSASGKIADLGELRFWDCDGSRRAAWDAVIVRSAMEGMSSVHWSLGPIFGGPDIGYWAFRIGAIDDASVPSLEDVVALVKGGSPCGELAVRF